MNNNNVPKADINSFINGRISKSPEKKKVSDSMNVLIENRITILLGLIAVSLIAIIFLQFNPPVQLKTENQKIFDEVKEVVDISNTETPIISKIPDAEQLRQTNSVMAEVYQYAEDGDYFIALSDQIIIFRSGNDEVIYQGPSPAQIVEERKRSLISTIKNLAIEQSIAIDAEETPELLAASDVDALKELDSEFYTNVQLNDVIAVFSTSEKIIIYRPSTAKIINSGTYSSSIIK